MRFALACLLLTGCFTGRAAIGGHQSTSGIPGFDASGGLGMGWSWTGHQAIYVSGNGGVAVEQHARAVVFDRVDYVNHATSIPFALGLRGGARIGRKKYGLADQSFGGAAFTLFPLHSKPGEHEDHSDDSWATAPIGPDIDGWGELGFEVAADVVQGQGGVFTFSLVIAGDTMIAK